MIIVKGKTNIEYLLVVVILAIIAGAGILFVALQGNIFNQPNFIPSTILSSEELLEYAKSSFDKEKMMGKDRIIGFYNGTPIRVTFPCSDICPHNTMRIIRYDVGVPECDETDGLVRAIYVPFGIGRRPEEFCFPKVIIDNNIYEFVEMPEDETANWKTYRNEKDGFKIKYPTNWLLKDNRLNKNNCHFDIYNLTEEKFTEMIAYIKKGGTNGCLIDPISINSIEAKKARCNARWDVENYNGYYLSQDEKFFRIFPWDEKNSFLKAGEPLPPDFIECNKIFNQMLSTFRFLEEDETANWKTYRNEEYGFEIEYPQDYVIKEFFQEGYEYFRLCPKGERLGIEGNLKEKSPEVSFEESLEEFVKHSFVGDGPEGTVFANIKDKNLFTNKKGVIGYEVYITERFREDPIFAFNIPQENKDLSYLLILMNQSGMKDRNLLKDIVNTVYF